MFKVVIGQAGGPPHGETDVVVDPYYGGGGAGGFSSPSGGGYTGILKRNINYYNRKYEIIVLKISFCFLYELYRKKFCLCERMNSLLLLEVPNS